MLIVLLALLAGALWWAGAGGDSEKGLPNPLVQGTPLSAWIQKALASDSTWNYAWVLKPVAAEATPYLSRALRHKDNFFNTSYVKIWPKLPSAFQRHLAAPTLAKDARMRAVMLLRDLGNPAKAAIPDLIARLSDNDGDLLNPTIALGNMGSDAKSALPSLEPLLRVNLKDVRVAYAAQAVWKITKEAEPSLSTLETVLAQTNANYRWAAAAFLGEMGPAARPAIPLLAQAVRDPDKDLASLSVQALANIGPETLPMLTDVLADAAPAMRISAAVALGRLGPKAKEAAPLLTMLVQDQATGSPLFWGHSSKWPEKVDWSIPDVDHPSTLFRLRPERVGDAAAEALARVNSP